MSLFAPDRGEIFGIQNGLRGWTAVQGLGPNYFVDKAVEDDLFAYVHSGSVKSTTIDALSATRASVVNFMDFLVGDGPFQPQPAAVFRAPTNRFIYQLGEQVRIWKSGTIKAMDFSKAETDILARVSVKATPVLYFMGFADAIPHSSQVARLCASMAHSLNGRHSDILLAALVGKLHDPKFEPKLDVVKTNLATHPIIAVALANAIFEDPVLYNALVQYFHGNRCLADDFVDGLRDALGVNNDSWFVQMMVILPQFAKRIGDKYGSAVADGFKAIMEGRLESASLNTPPPALPPHLHGCLAQEFLDSGLRGISQCAWTKALAAAEIDTDDPVALFHKVMVGTAGDAISADGVAKVRAELRANRNAILSAMVSATRLLHHHQEVVASARIAAAALVIADPLMLSPHKVCAVYDIAIIDRLRSYCKSFDDNIRLLPVGASKNGRLWQRAVYLSMLVASDKLTGATQLASFRAENDGTTLLQDINQLRMLCLKPETWGKFADAKGWAAANADVQQALDALEAAYVDVVNQYREAVYAGTENLSKFYPKV